MVVMLLGECILHTVHYVHIGCVLQDNIQYEHPMKMLSGNAGSCEERSKCSSVKAKVAEGFVMCLTVIGGHRPFYVHLNITTIFPQPNSFSCLTLIILELPCMDIVT